MSMIEMYEYDVKLLMLMCVCVCVYSAHEKRVSGVSLRFHDATLEMRYSAEEETQTGIAFTCSCVVLLCCSAMEILIDPQ